MGAAVAVEVAAQTRERLAAFVGEMVLALPHVRQRENALVYVRWSSSSARSPASSGATRKW